MKAGSRPDSLLMAFEIAIAAGISIIWVAFAGKEYGYNTPCPVIMGLNVFLLIAWTAGLTFVYNVYLWVEEKAAIKNPWLQFLVFWFIHSVLIITLEAVGYHILGIKNLAAARYPGLPLLNCLHAPRWMQAAYFTLGPAMFIGCKVLGRVRIFAAPPGDAGRWSG